MPNEKICFVIAPMSEPDTEIHKRCDQIFKHIIEPVVQELGYKAEMPHHISAPGAITTQIVGKIINADLLIADLTGSNPNVMYELAIRHVVKKPVVQLIRNGEKLPFDISHQRTIELDHTDLDSVAAVKAELAKQVRAVEENPSLVDSPVSMAVDLGALRSSGDPTHAALVEIGASLRELKQSQDRTFQLLQSKVHVTDVFDPSEPELTWNRQENTFRLMAEILAERATLGEQLGKQFGGLLQQADPRPRPPKGATLPSDPLPKSP
nr:hypothetical protein [Nitrosomonas nitrosa]